MTPDEAVLANLAERSQRGDKSAYAEFLEASNRWLRRYYGRKLPSERVDDLVQETLLAIHLKLYTYDPQREIYPWLAAIARYRFVDYLRSTYRAPIEAELDERIADTAVDLESMTARVSLDRLLQELPPAQRQAIELVKIEGLSIGEAAAVMGQSEALIKVNIHRGLKRLAAQIEKS